MVNTSIRLGVALATLFNVAVVTANENPRSLDTTGGTANDTGFIGMLEEENDFDHGNSITERKNCPASRQCTNSGGSCIKSTAVCGGRVDHKGCKGKKCKCCIPDPTTPAPSTCPTCQACPISTCEPSPTPAATTTSSSILQRPGGQDYCIRKNFVACRMVIDNCEGFEWLNKRLIRRPIRSDPKYAWNTAMKFCNQFGSDPLIPTVDSDYAIYKNARASLGSDNDMWLPASDLIVEGKLQWNNRKTVSGTKPLDWAKDKYLDYNAGTRDCLIYGSYRGAYKVYMWECTKLASPPVCVIP